MKFKYKAQNPEGQLQVGVVEADSREEAIDTLHSHNLTILSLISERELPTYKREVKIPFLHRIRQKDLVVFSRELATLIEGRVSLVESLKSLAQQTLNPRFRNIISSLAQEIEGGSSLSKALAKYPNVFSDFYINLVQSAEVSGTLEKTLVYLADYEEKRYDTISKIKGALTYPALVTIFTLAVGIFAMVGIVPQITSMLTEANVELPLTTKILIGASHFLKNYWYIVLLLSTGIIFGWWKWIHTKEGRRLWGKFLIKLPIFGKILRHFYLNRIAENLKTLLKGGVSVLKALEIVASVTGNSVYKDIILETREEVRGGKSMSSVFQTYREIPPMFTEMVRVGEHSGNVDEMLGKLATFYKREVDEVIENLSKLIEPMLIIVLGLGVGLLVSSIIIPIYRMTQAF